jgi:hypothetical protein
MVTIATRLTHLVGSLHRRVSRQLKYLAAGIVVLSFIIDSVDRPNYILIFGRSTEYEQLLASSVKHWARRDLAQETSPWVVSLHSYTV